MKYVYRFLALLSCALMLMLTTATAGADGGTPTLLQTIKVPGTPGRWDVMAIDPGSHHLYLSDTTNQSLDVLDLQTGQFVAQISGLPMQKSATGSVSGSNGLAVAANLGKVFVSDQVDNALHVYDMKSNTQTAVIPTTQDGSDSVAYDPVEKKVYVSNGSSHTITVIDGTNNQVLSQIALPGGPELSAYDPFNDTIIQNLSSTNQVAVIDPKTDTIRVVYNLVPGCGPHGVGVDPANQHLVIACTHMTVIMDAGDGSILSATRHVYGSDVADYNPIDNNFYVAASGFKPSPVLGVLSAATNDWVQNVPTAAGAHTLVVDPTDGKIYVGAQTPGTILVFSHA